MYLLRSKNIHSYLFFFVHFCFISIYCFLLSPILMAFDSFQDNECMENVSQVSVSHKTQPFGLLSQTIQINKNKCVLNIYFTKWKFFKDDWLIDVCRGPVHIKKEGQIMDVLKREGPCQREEFQQTKYCQEWKKLKLIIQDDGLIFAEGEKENLKTDHGKIYCSYLLLKKYLQDNYIFENGMKLPEKFLHKDLTNFYDEFPHLINQKDKKDSGLTPEHLKF